MALIVAVDSLGKNDRYGQKEINVAKFRFQTLLRDQWLCYCYCAVAQSVR